MSNKIRELRQINNLTQKELAIKSNVSLSYIQKLELNIRKNPGIAYANSIAEALNSTVQELFFD